MNKLLICFLCLITFSGRAQNAVVKELFYDLPIDKTKETIKVAISEDTLLFQKSENDQCVTVKRKNPILDESPADPALCLHIVKIYVDSMYKGSIANLTLTFTFNSRIGKKRKSEKVYKILSQKLLKDFTDYSDRDVRYETTHYVVDNIEKERTFINIANGFPKCTLQLIKSTHNKAREVIIKYELD